MTQRTGDTEELRVCLVANSRFPIRQPFIGGLESMTWHLARALVRRGHRVALFAAPGSDPSLDVEELRVRPSPPAHGNRPDLEPSLDVEASEHDAYSLLMTQLVARGPEFDVLHNNSLHPVPIQEAGRLPFPVLTTLHTPPLVALQEAVERGGGSCGFAAVSEFTARSWLPLVEARCIPNGVDTDMWAWGPGGRRAVWSGRMVPEKAPHEAIDAARLARVDLVLAGPVLDQSYFDSEVAPRLGRGATYAGHLGHAALADLVGRSAVAIATPAWDEPYGLVAAEALSCGTPVAAYARGGLPEIVGDHGHLAPGGDVAALAEAILVASRLDRGSARRHAVQLLSIDRMCELYESHYRSMAGTRNAA